MASKLYTPEQTASSLIAGLRYVSSLPRTVRQDFSTEFVSGRGQTISIKAEPVVGPARDYTEANRQSRADIEFDDVTQRHVPVKMDTQAYSAVRLPDDFATFQLEMLEREVLAPQAKAVASRLPKPLVAEMAKIKTVPAQGAGQWGDDKSKEVALSAGTALKIAADGSNVLRVITRLSGVLTKREVPAFGRFLAVSPEVAELISLLPALNAVDSAGDGGVLYDNTLGRIKGFTIVEDPLIPAGTAIAYDRDAFAMVTRPSRVPEGAAFGAAVAQDGFSLRHIMQYDPRKLEDQSVVDCFYAAATLDDRRAVAVQIG